MVGSTERGEEIFDLDAMKRLGGGGTHDVYLRPEVPGILVRFPRARASDHVSAADEENTRFALLEHYFGEWCIPRHARTALVRRDGEIRKAVVITEPFEPALHDARRLEVRLAYLELMPGNDAIRRCIDTAIVEGAAFPLADLLAFADNPLPLFAPGAADAALLDVMARFCRVAGSFVRKTGLLLDIAGSDNIVAVPAEDGWTLRMGAVLKNDTWVAFVRGLERLAAEGAAVVASDAPCAATLLNGLATTRLLSALAAATGEESLCLPPIPNLLTALDALPAALQGEPWLQELHRTS
jgi:hypothetical protein